MNALRKIGQWFWRNKERLVLIVLVAFLVFRVYRVIYPDTEDTAVTLLPPGRTMPPGVVPEPPGPPPPLPGPESWTTLVARNPFLYERAGRNGRPGTDEFDGVDVEVLMIREVRDGYKARIRTGRNTGWYGENEGFEDYTLLSIDNDTKCCQIFANNLGRTIERCVDENARGR